MISCPYRPDSKVHGANMGPIWGRQDPGVPHVGSMNFAMWGYDSPPIENDILLHDPDVLVNF